MLTLEVQEGCMVLLLPRAVTNPTESLGGSLESIFMGGPVKEEPKPIIDHRETELRAG